MDIEYEMYMESMWTANIKCIDTPCNFAVYVFWGYSNKNNHILKVEIEKCNFLKNILFNLEYSLNIFYINKN